MDKLSENRNLINPLLMSQYLAVLATYYDDQPYNNLVAFAVTDDLEHILFVTSKNTRKYENIRMNKKVAMLIDSRKNENSDFKNAFALTAIGIAKEMTSEKRNRLAEIYLNKHPYIAEFLNAADSALISIAVSDYIIASFDKSIHVRIRDNP
jgi:heme iron utilization protein